MEKLRSLGYLSSYQASKKETFSPEDDVKTLLPYNNKAVEAMDLYQKGKVQEAIQLLKWVISERKSLDNAYSNLAILYEKQGHIREALEVLELGFENVPSSYELFFNYVSLLTKAGRPEEIIKISSVKHFPQMENDPEFLNFLGVAYARTEDFAKAIEFYERGLALDNRYPALYNNLGMACFSLSLKTKDSRIFQKGLQSFKKAIELDPQYPLPYNGLAMAYRQIGNLDGAIYSWEKALELKPDFGAVLYSLGLAYMDKANYAKALDLLFQYRQKYFASPSPEEINNLEKLISICRQKAGK